MAHFLISQWLPLMMNAALQSVLAPTAVAFAFLVMRRMAAARRHLLLVVALGSLLLLPPASLLLRAHPITPPLPVNAAQSLPPSQPMSVPPAPLSSPQAPSTTTSTAPISQPPVPIEIAPAAPPSRSFSPRFLVNNFFTLWAAGVLFVLARLFMGLRRLNGVARQCQRSLPDPLQARIASLLAEVGVKRPLIVLLGVANTPISVPMTWGAWSPILLLPAPVEDWPEERLRVVVRHELAHIQRGDWLTQTAAQIVCALYWFNPLVWLIARQLRLEAERACDDAVLSSGMVAAPDYAAHLLAVVRLVQTRRPWSAAVTMARSSQVGDRVKSILDPRRSRRAVTRVWWVLACLAMCALVLPITILRPLAPAAADSTPPVSVPASPSGSQVTLPGGITVELVGVGSSPTGDGEDWWAPDGTPLPEAPQENFNRFHNIQMGLGTQYLRRALFFRLHARQATDASTTGYVVDPTKHQQTYGYHFGRDQRLNSAALLPDRPATGVVLLGFPQSEKTITYRFGIATGSWQTIAVTKNTLHPAPGAIRRSHGGYFYGPNIWLTSKPGVGYAGVNDKPGDSHELSLLSSHAPLGDVARRLQAFDKNGKIIPLEEYGSGYDGEPSSQLSAEDLNRVAEFRLQTRPYQWAEFKGIVLQPHAVNGVAPPTPIAMPPAPPGFQKTLPSGITIALNALTERRADGGRWWQPDGALLPGPIKDEDASFGGWPSQMHPKALVLTLTSLKNVDYSEATQFLIGGKLLAPVFHLHAPLRLLKNQPSPEGMNEEFPMNASSCTLRFGLAVGSWQTVAVQKVHFTPAALLRQKVAPDKDYEGDVTLELSAHPKLIYTDARGKTHTQAFLSSPIGDALASRFVAVDAHGVVTPLQICLSGRTGDLVGLAFDKHSATRDYNRTVDLAQVREFRLQTRPYEWTEFPNIALKPHSPRTP